jgi:dTDP-L-rhamnose 4-epimerase
MRALVTGGAGLIGSHLVDLLVHNGYEVTILDNLDEQTHLEGKPDWIKPKAKFVLGDVCNKGNLEEALKGVDVIFHQAAFGGFTPELTKYLDVNVTGTGRIFEIIKEHKLPIKKIVIASSQAIYAEGTYRCLTHGVQYPPPRPLEQFTCKEWEVKCTKCKSNMHPLLTNEEKPLHGKTVYALSKFFEEKLALSLGMQIGIPVVALRYAVTYGPRQSLYNPYTGVVSIFSTRILNNLGPVIYEDGLQTRDFIYVSDVARANIFVMEHEKTAFESFNVGTGQSTTVLKLVHALCEAYNIDVEPVLHSDFRPGDVRHFVHDSSKLQALGFKPVVSLEEGIIRTAEWIKGQSNVKESFSDAEKLLKKHKVVLSG